LANFYEIDFLPVHTSKSGDAIAIRFQVSDAGWEAHIVDGGYFSTAPDLAGHIFQYYGGTRYINRVVVTHPDKDHAEGLAAILDAYQVGELWMLRPWLYANVLAQFFSRYNSAIALEKRLRDEYPYIVKLEEIATQKGIPIHAPFQGSKIGPFTVLAPSWPRYAQLILDSDKTPQLTPQTSGILGALMQSVPRAIRFIKSGWGSERFSAEETSPENEMSVIQYAVLNNEKILLTGDAGRGALKEAADYAPNVGLILPGIDRFQVPHHGGRRNVSTEILDRWLGPRLATPLPEGQKRFTAMISSAKEDTDHPRKAVLRAMRHRGAFIATTENGPFTISAGINRGWGTMTNVPYPDEQEED
jgi:hypothetical protein